MDVVGDCLWKLSRSMEKTVVFEGFLAFDGPDLLDEFQLEHLQYEKLIEEVREKFTEVLVESSRLSLDGIIGEMVDPS